MPALEGLRRFGKNIGAFSSDIAPLGRILTAGAGLTTGIIQGQRAKKLTGQADKLLPPAEDPETRNLLNTLRRKARAIETGTDPVTAAGRKIIARNVATTQGNIVRSSARDPRKVLEGFRRTSVDASTATGRLAASTYPASRFYTELRSNLLNRISSRKFDLSMSQRAQKLREAAEARSAANRNISGALGFALPS